MNALTAARLFRFKKGKFYDRAKCRGQSGSAEMAVDDENRQVAPGDATWIPTGSKHSLLNNKNEDLVILVVASPNW